MSAPLEACQEDHPNPNYQPGVVPHRYTLARLGFTGLFGLGGGVSYSGGENLPRGKKSFVVSPAHDTALDPFPPGIAVWRELKRMMYTMAKQEAWDNPVMATILDASCAFAVDRGKSIGQQSAMLAYAHQLVDGGEILEICPQGTRKNHEKLQVPLDSLRPGSMLLPALYGLDVVPTASIGGLYRYVYFNEPVNPGQHDFDIRDRRESLQVAREIIEPFYEAELQPRMQAAVDEALSRREAIIHSMPQRLLSRALLR